MDYFDRILGADTTEYEAADSVRSVDAGKPIDSDKSSYNGEKSDKSALNTQSFIFNEHAQKVTVAPAKPSPWNIIVSLVVYLLLIPATFYICLRSGDRRLYIGSLIIMVLAMLPFFFNFERRKPNARELVTLAVLTAAAVVSRIAFMWLPAFKPMAGFITITAMCFGPQAGFMSGALSMLVSNVVFGQGPWTPWQMFCYGMIGFIAGLLARPGIMSHKHALRSGIITFFVVTVLSSAILDSSTLFFMFSRISKASILTIYIAGLPMNVLNGLASGMAVLFLSKPITAIINRIKIKYGIH